MERPRALPRVSGGEDFSVAAFLFLCFILREEKIKSIVEMDRSKAIESSRPDSFLPVH